MELHPGNIQGYKNEVIIPGSDAAIGHNLGINESEPVVPTARSTGKVAQPAGTVHKGPAVPAAAQRASGAAVVPALLPNKQNKNRRRPMKKKKRP